MTRPRPKPRQSPRRRKPSWYEAVWRVLNPRRRKVIYAAVFAVTLAVLVCGLVTQDQLDDAISAAGSIVGTVTALMAFLNTGDPND